MPASDPAPLPALPYDMRERLLAVLDGQRPASDLSPDDRAALLVLLGHAADAYDTATPEQRAAWRDRSGG